MAEMPLTYVNVFGKRITSASSDVIFLASVRITAGPSSSLNHVGVAARRGHGKTRRGQRGQNLSDHAQLLTTLSVMHMQRIYKKFICLEFKVFHKYRI